MTTIRTHTIISPIRLICYQVRRCPVGVGTHAPSDAVVPEPSLAAIATPAGRSFARAAQWLAPFACVLALSATLAWTGVKGLALNVSPNQPIAPVPDPL